MEFYKKVSEEERFSELMKASLREKCAFLLSQNRSMFLMKVQWLKIFADIKKKPESFRRYYPMVRVNVDDKTKWLVYAFVANEDFYRYCMNG